MPEQEFDNVTDLEHVPVTRKARVPTSYLLSMWFTFYIGAIIQSVAHAILLPPIVVSSFDEDMQPESTATKGKFIATYVVVVQTFPNLFLFVLVLLTLRGDIVPRATICIPYHWYWAHTGSSALVMAEKRIARSFAWVGTYNTCACQVSPCLLCLVSGQQ